MKKNRYVLFITLLAVCLQPSLSYSLEGDMPNEGILPARVFQIFKQNCLTCHGDKVQMGQLNLLVPESLLKEGKNGKILVAGKADESLLYLTAAHRVEPHMPFNKPQLPLVEIEAIKQWINEGATAYLPENVDATETTHWSLQPLQYYLPPDIQSGWVRTPIDKFVLYSLREKGFSPAPEADRRTVIRRLTYDLHGLPPTPDEVDAFVNDEDPNAYEKLVNSLLASPRYGERWGRHWLDVAHYGDTHGYDKDKRRENAYPYRDYVIRSLNDDKPYGRFIEEQLAGDALFPNDPDGIVATGFIAAGPWDFVGHAELREGTTDKAITRNLDRDDMLTNTMTTFMSVTVHCARCHDHKFDPVSQEEYYSLQAFFAGVDRAERPFDPDPEIHQQRSGLTAYLDELNQKQADAILRNATSAELAEQIANARVKVKALPSPQWVYAAASDFKPMMTFSPAKTPRPVFLLNRGEVTSPVREVQPAALSCIDGMDSQLAIQDIEDEGQRRAALAKWISDPNNALTWRSIVNRVWHYHFGKGIVDTPNDFGKMGGAPTHPELLDWLAREFLRNGQSLKWLHKTIVTSAVYRQSSAHNPRYAETDADNRYLWRMNRARLDAESLRDSVLMISGKMGWKMGGPGFDCFEFIDDHSPHYLYDKHDVTDPAAFRRSVYRFAVRSVPDPFIECLDGADPSQNVPVRNATITALQALAALNNPFMVQQAKYFADRLRGFSKEPSEQIRRAYRLTFGRFPTESEERLMLDYANRHGLANACRLLFNTNEFMFVD